DCLPSQLTSRWRASSRQARIPNALVSWPTFFSTILHFVAPSGASTDRSFTTALPPSSGGVSGVSSATSATPDRRRHEIQDERHRVRVADDRIEAHAFVARRR